MLFVMVFETEDKELRRAVCLTGIEMWRQRLFQTFIALSGNVQLFPPVLWSPCTPLMLLGSKDDSLMPFSYIHFYSSYWNS